MHREFAGLISRGPGRPLGIEVLHVPRPLAGEAVVRVEASGLCHTDLMVADGVWWTEPPYLLGHEGVGIVEEVGAPTDAALLGRRVLIAWRGVCGDCRFCRSGRPAWCVDLPQAARRIRTNDDRPVTPALRVGSHAERTLAAVGQLVPVPSDLPAETLCLIGCGVLTGYGAVVHTAGVEPDRTVVVLGCGAVGTSIVQVAAAVAGAGRVVAVDTRPDKLATARALGATDTVLAGSGDGGRAALREVLPDGADYVFDAVGTAATMQLGIDTCDIGGTCVLVGTPDRGAVWPLALPEIFFRRLTLRCCQYGDVLPAVDVAAIVDLYREGRLRLDDMVSAVISLADAPAALEALRGGSSGVRTVLRPGS